MGCKVAVVDPTGKVLDTNVVYPVPEFKRVDQAKKTIKAMVLKNGVEVMAIGNGTAGHETEEFAAEVIRELADEKNLHLQYMVVSEAGASVYSGQPSWPPRSSPSLTSTCAAQCPSHAACRTRWPSWSRSIPRPSASASTSTTCPRSA